MTARNKIKPLAELADLAAAARAEGRKVVLCHGVFDLLHMGHVRHFEAAHDHGDVLIVTLTADRFVNKGPGRPIFPELLRAEMVAAMEYVDWVGVNHDSSAETVLNAIMPDVYVKGSDYENPEEDVTGKIVSERDAVERHGGRLVFTKDITFSSSSLINKYLDVYDPPLRDFLEDYRQQGAIDEITALIDKVKDYRVLLVGDTIIDEYQYVTTLGKSPKENMIATLYRDREVFAGGVIAAANHVANFCREVEVITVLGESDSQEELVRAAVHPNVKLHILKRPGAPTTRKCRFVEPAYVRKMFEVYHMNDGYYGPKLEQQLVELVAERAQACDVTLVTDFGHGLMTRPVIESASTNARFLAVNAQSNSSNMGFNLITRYPRADYICIDTPEIRLALGDRFTEVPVMASEVLPNRVPCSRIIITQGSQGCSTWQPEHGVHRVPAFTKTIIDTVGAGDAFLAVTSPLVAAGGRMDHVGFIGNAAGAIKVGIVGHRRSVEKAPLVKFITTLLK